MRRLLSANEASWIFEPNRYMAFECLIAFPSRERFFLRPGSVLAKTLNSQLTSAAPGWFGYGRPLEYLPTGWEVETAPNSYAGSGGLDLAGQDGGDHSQAASQKPLRAARRLFKTASSISSRSNGNRQAITVGIETHSSWNSYQPPHRLS
jgi:hypothetical protein